ncbi:MAG: transposase [Cyanobacteria bacterium J06649_11]
MAKRKTYTTKFKKQVALEAIKEHLTIPQIAQKFNVHPSQIKTWKRILTEDSDSLFEHGNRQKNKPQDGEKEKDNLLRIIGKLQVEIDFLKKTLE